MKESVMVTFLRDSAQRGFAEWVAQSDKVRY
jgi:hypothetical protein